VLGIQYHHITGPPIGIIYHNHQVAIILTSRVVLGNKNGFTPKPVGSIMMGLKPPPLLEIHLKDHWGGGGGGGGGGVVRVQGISGGDEGVGG